MRGLPGVSEAGPTGFKGYPGMVGDRGPQGLPGAPGQEGPKGYPGRWGMKGDRGDVRIITYNLYEY